MSYPGLHIVAKILSDAQQARYTLTQMASKEGIATKSAQQDIMLARMLVDMNEAISVRFTKIASENIKEKKHGNKK